MNRYMRIDTCMFNVSLSFALAFTLCTNMYMYNVSVLLSCTPTHTHKLTHAHAQQFLAATTHTHKNAHIPTHTNTHAHFDLHSDTDKCIYKTYINAHEYIHMYGYTSNVNSTRIIYIM